LQDLEDYLQNSIGRSAQATLATREKLAENDNEMELWTHQLEEIRAQIALKELELKKIQDALKKEAGLSKDARQTGANEDGTPADTGQTGRVSLSAEKIAILTSRTGQLESQIIELKKQEAELIDKIKQRFDEHQARFDDSFYTAKKWQQTLDGWQMFSDTKKQEIRNMIDHYGEGGTVVVSTPTPGR
jgi:Tfp pilus assembly protein FimV